MYRIYYFEIEYSLLSKHDISRNLEKYNVFRLKSTRPRYATNATNLVPQFTREISFLRK